MEKELKEMIEKLETMQNETSKVSINLSQMRAWIQTYISIQDKEKSSSVGHLNDAWNLIDWVSEHYPNVYNEYVEKHPDSVWKKH